MVVKHVSAAFTAGAIPVVEASIKSVNGRIRIDNRSRPNLHTPHPCQHDATLELRIGRVFANATSGYPLVTSLSLFV